MTLSPLAALGHEILEINRANGWNVCTPEDLPTNNPDANTYKIPAVLALIASEVTEYWDSMIPDVTDYVNPNHVAEELADVQIRILDMVFGLGFDFDTLVWNYATGAPVYPVSADDSWNVVNMHCTVSYALESYRAGDSAEMAGHLASLFVLVSDIARSPSHQFDMGLAISEKLAKNRKRGFRHGGKKV